MKTALTLLFAFFISFSSFSQTYDELVSSAFAHLKNNDEKNFKKVYPKLFSAYFKNQVSGYQEAISAATSHDKEGTFESLNKVVSDTVLLDEIKADKTFSILHNDGRWESLLDRIESIEKGYNNKVRKELLKVHRSDQSIRLLVLEAYKKYGKESAEARMVRAEMKEIDKISGVRIQRIISKHGWLGSDEVGYFGNQTFFLAIQHVEDTVVQQKYLPVMLRAVKEGKAKPWQYAMLQDRILMNQGKPQIYGTQKVIDKDPAKSYIIPLQDPENVDSLRAEVGLGPLKEDLEEEGMGWDVEEYRKRLPEIERMYKERYLRLNSEQN